MNSILLSIKKLLGIEESYKDFDIDLIMHINTTLSVLTQLGVGPSEGYSITDENNTWDEFVDDSRLEMVKSYILMKVRLLFDPPLSSVTIGAIKENIAELEWRINSTVDPGKEA